MMGYLKARLFIVLLAAAYMGFRYALEGNPEGLYFALPASLVVALCIRSFLRP